MAVPPSENPMSEMYSFAKPQKTIQMVEAYFSQSLAGKFIHELKKTAPDALILDLGAGRAMESNHLQQLLPDKRVISLDINKRGIHRNNREPGVEALQADALQIPLRDAFLTGIHSKDMLVHIQNHDAFLAELSRVLSVGGWLYIVSAAADKYTEYQYPWSPFRLRMLALKYGLKPMGSPEKFRMEQDDWYPRRGAVRTEMLFQKQEKLSTRLFKRLQQLKKRVFS